MSIKTKLAAVALAAVTLTGAIAATTGEAAAGPKFGPAIGLGIAAGAAIGLAAASTAYAHPYRAYGYYQPVGCRWVPVHNYYGQYVGSKRVCW